MQCINKLAKIECVGGSFVNGGIDKIFDPDLSLNDTYYWDDTSLSPEGFRLTFPHEVLINRIELYACDRYPMEDVRFLIDDKVIHSDTSVTEHKPMIFEGSIIGSKLEIFRYTVKDTAIQKIVIYGSESVKSFLLKKDDVYYTVKNNAIVKIDSFENSPNFLKNNGFKDCKVLTKDFLIKSFSNFKNLKLLMSSEEVLEKNELKYKLDKPFQPLTQLSGEIEILRQTEK